MIKERTLYSLRDISVIPCVTTDINSRSECNPYRTRIEGQGEALPIITAPMSCVLNETNYTEFLEAGVNCIVPRTVDYEIRLKLMESVFCAFSMREATKIYNFDIPENKVYKILIDNANGHMKSHIKLGKLMKKKFGDKILIMGGNIANPNAYLSYEFAGFDYVRAGIGTGNCCFVANTQITMTTGIQKPIQELQIGDKVKTKDGEGLVTNLIEKTSDDGTLIINNELECTPNHELFVVNIEDKDKITEDNLNKFGYFIKAKDLDPLKYLLVKLTKELIKIESIEQKDNIVPVYDIEVITSHSYIANNYVVHNCITSTQTAIHYPLASLISDICDLRPKDYHCKVIADGGIANYSDIVKCMALGADYVMCGKLFSKAALKGEDIGTSKMYYGMSTKMAQKEMGNEKTKTSEGRHEEVTKEYTLSGWCENMHDYMCSAMSYCDSKTLNEFKEKAVCQVISPNSSRQVNDK